MDPRYSGTPLPCSAPPLQLVSRSQLERGIGFLTHAPLIQAGHIATRLLRLYGGGGLYLTYAAELAEVRPTSSPEILRGRKFSGTPASMWEAVAAALREVRIGITLSRFWMAEEIAPLTSCRTYGVLDLAAMDVVERGSEAEEVRRRVHSANSDPGGYLRELLEQQKREALRGIQASSGMAIPR